MTPINDLTPFGMFLLGEEPVRIPQNHDYLNQMSFGLISNGFLQTIEDFILLIGTIVAFIAFVLWCCFPIHPKVRDKSIWQSVCFILRTTFLLMFQFNWITLFSLAMAGKSWASIVFVQIKSCLEIVISSKIHGR